MSLRLSLSVLALCLALPSAMAQTWNAADDFDKDNNPAGAWSYGYRLEDAGSFTPFSMNGSFDNIDFWYGSGGLPSIGHNASGTTQVDFVENGTLILHPGNTAQDAGEQVFVQWTAPVAGAYSVGALFTGVDNRDPHVALRVTKNGVNMWGDVLEGTGTVKSFDTTTWTLSAGDTVGFGVANLGSFTGDRNWIRLDANVQAVPEPASIAALGLGTLGILKRRKKA